MLLEMLSTSLSGLRINAAVLSMVPALFEAEKNLTEECVVCAVRGDVSSGGSQD